MGTVAGDMKLVKDISVQESTGGAENIVSSKNFVVSITLFVLGVLSVLAGFILVCLCIFSVLNPTILIIAGSFVLMLLGLILVAISISIGSKKLLKLKREVGESQEEVGSVKRELRDIKDKLDRVEQESKQKVESLNNEMESLRDELQDKDLNIQEAINRERVAKEALRQYEDDMTGRQKKMVSSNQKLKEENDQLNKEIVLLKDHLRLQETKCEEANRSTATMEQEIEVMNQNFRKYQEDVAEREDELEADVRAMSQKNQLLKREKFSLECTIEEYKTLLRRVRLSLEEEYLDLEMQISQGHKVEEESSLTLQNLREKLELLKSRVQLDRAGLDDEDDFDSRRRRAQSQ